jgi:hypothetical protein
MHNSLIAAMSLLVVNLRAQEKYVLFAVENFLFFCDMPWTSALSLF